MLNREHVNFEGCHCTHIAPSLTRQVADFGLSVLLDNQQTHLSNVHSGTITHMAPELILEVWPDAVQSLVFEVTRPASERHYVGMQGRMDKSTDVYAFGILLYEVIAGCSAFSGRAMVAISHAVVHKSERPMFPASTPSPIVDLACRCWDVDSTARPTFSQVVERLEALRVLHRRGELVSQPLLALGAQYRFAGWCLVI